MYYVTGNMNWWDLHFAQAVNKSTFNCLDRNVLVCFSRLSELMQLQKLLSDLA